MLGTILNILNQIVGIADPGGRWLSAGTAGRDDLHNGPRAA
jgi:hypothetical protein